jgi:hypothetical protein
VIDSHAESRLEGAEKDELDGTTGGDWPKPKLVARAAITLMFPTIAKTWSEGTGITGQGVDSLVVVSDVEA